VTTEQSDEKDALPTPQSLVDGRRADALTTRGPRLPRTLADYRDRPIAAYNLGYHEAREAGMNGLTVSEDGSLLNWQGENYVRQSDLGDDEPELAAAVTTQAEEPIDHRLRRAWLNGYGEGFNRGSWGDDRWDR
jgi:hypothetical protein